MRFEKISDLPSNQPEKQVESGKILPEDSLVGRLKASLDSFFAPIEEITPEEHLLSEIEKLNRPFI